MLVEMRTYSLRPGKVPQALDKIALGVQERMTLSPLGGLWSTEVGELHQLVHIWPYDSLAHREQVRGQFAGLKNWPAHTTEFMHASETKILKPAPFSPPLPTGRLGPLYEICTDTMHPGAADRVIASWSARIADRMQLSPLVGAWQSTLGPMYQWIHIWAYESFEQRQQVRDEAARNGTWPPPEDPDRLFVRQQAALFKPAPFSPLQ